MPAKAYDTDSFKCKTISRLLELFCTNAYPSKVCPRQKLPTRIWGGSDGALQISRRRYLTIRFAMVVDATIPTGMPHAGESIPTMLSWICRGRSGFSSIPQRNLRWGPKMIFVASTTVEVKGSDAAIPPHLCEIVFSNTAALKSLPSSLQ